MSVERRDEETLVVTSGELEPTPREIPETEFDTIGGRDVLTELSDSPGAWVSAAWSVPLGDFE